MVAPCCQGLSHVRMINSSIYNSNDIQHCSALAMLPAQSKGARVFARVALVSAAIIAFIHYNQRQEREVRAHCYRILTAPLAYPLVTH